MEERLGMMDVSYSFLSDQAQNELTRKLREPGSTLHDDHVKLEFGSVADAINALSKLLGRDLSAVAVYNAYDIEHGAAFLAKIEDIMRIINSDPFFISSDGMVILLPDASGGVILDYEGASRQSPASMTLLGVFVEPADAIRVDGSKRWS
jgi:hypothetical protein